MARRTEDQGQPSTRRPGRWTDQHGRKWHASVDIRSGGAVGPIRPLGWRAPLMPDQTYFKFDADDVSKMTIDYQRMLDDRLASHEGYARDWNEFATARGWDPTDESKAGQIIAKIGKKPQPTEPILAAMQGNKWILGQTQIVDTRLLPFLPKKESRTEKALGAVDFSFDPDEQPESLKDDLDALMDIEEAVDPEATPRGRVPVKPKKPKAAA